MKLDRILFATDLGVTARTALARLTTLATSFGSEVHLLHVASDWQAFVSSGLVERQARDRLEQWATELRQEGIVVAVDAVRGSAAEQIVERAEALQVDLLMLGAGDAWHERARAGAVARAVAHAAQGKLWIDVPTDGPSIRRIVCGIDGSESSAAALRAADHAKNALGAELVVVAALDNPDVALFGVDPATTERELEAHRQSSVRELARFASELLEREATPIHSWGRAAEVLRGVAVDRRADLIVIGRTGKGRLRRLLLGGTADRLLQSLPASLLIVP